MIATEALLADVQGQVWASKLSWTPNKPWRQTKWKEH